MVTLIEGVVNDVLPLSNKVPPEEAEYQSIVWPPPGVADKITVPVPHLETFVLVGNAGIVFIVATTAVLVEERHPEVVFLACA